MTKLNDDPENPEWTPEMVAGAQRGIAHLPGSVREAIQNTRRGRGPQQAPTKMLVSLRIARSTVAAYKSTGRGWQSRMDADLARTAQKVVGGSYRRMGEGTAHAKTSQTPMSSTAEIRRPRSQARKAAKKR